MQIQNDTLGRRKLHWFLLAFFILIVTVSAIYFITSNRQIQNQKPISDSTKINLSTQMYTEITDSDKQMEGQITEIKNSTQPISDETEPETQGLKTDIGSQERNEISTVDTVVEKKLGGLYITAYPWAEIYVRGSYMATTPLEDVIYLEPGIHDLELRNPAFKTHQKSVQITPGRIDSLQFWLDEVFGRLNISVTPWGNVYINDQYLDTTPLKQPVQLKKGVYKILVTNPYYRDYVETIEIAAGGEYQLSVDMTQ
jgi:hypothetical protein